MFYSLQDLVARTETNKLVTDLVNLDRVRSLLKTISLRRQFLKHLERKQAEKFKNGASLRLCHVLARLRFCLSV